MRLCTHIALTLLAALLAAHPSAATPAGLEELSPDAAPAPAAIVNAFPACWKAEGLPAVRATGSRMSVFGWRDDASRWVRVQEGWARAAGYAAGAEGQPALSYELVLSFERARDSAHKLSQRYERKLAEFQRITKLSPPFPGPGYSKVSTDFVGEPPAKGAEQICLLRFGNDVGASLLSLELVLLWKDGCYDYLLELAVLNPEMEDYRRIALALQESLKAIYE